MAGHGAGNTDARPRPSRPSSSRSELKALRHHQREQQKQSRDIKSNLKIRPGDPIDLSNAKNGSDSTSHTSSLPDKKHSRPRTRTARSVSVQPSIMALSDADIDIIDHVPPQIPTPITPTIAMSRATNSKSMPAPPQRKAKSKTKTKRSKRELRDHLIRMLKNPRATLSILGGIQQGTRGWQKGRPDYTGGDHFHAGNMAGFISKYRMFHNLADWLTIYEMIKSQRAAGLHSGEDKFATVMGWFSTLGYAGYLFTEFACFLGLSEVFKLSRLSARNSRRVDDFDRWSAQAFMLWIVAKGLQHFRENVLDKRLAKQREANRPHVSTLDEAGRKARLEEDEEFYKAQKLRKAKRKRFAVINGFWTPAAIHWALKKSPFDKRTGCLFAVLAQMSKVYFFWGDARTV